MVSLLERLAERLHATWLLIAGLVVGTIAAIDRYLYRRYSQRLADSTDWTEAQRQRIEDLTDRIDDLEARADRAERHAERCEKHLKRITHRIAEDSDVEWHPDDLKNTK